MSTTKLTERQMELGESYHWLSARVAYLRRHKALNENHAGHLGGSPSVATGTHCANLRFTSARHGDSTVCQAKDQTDGAK